jgi:hypothetical protein
MDYGTNTNSLSLTGGDNIDDINDTLINLATNISSNLSLIDDVSGSLNTLNGEVQDLSSVVDTKVSKSGDTMTGDLLIESSSQNPTLTLWSKATSSRKPTIDLIRNSSTFGADGNYDWRIINDGGLFRLQTQGTNSGYTGLRNMIDINPVGSYFTIGDNLTPIVLDGNSSITGTLTINNSNEINYKSQTLDERFVKVVGDAMTGDLTVDYAKIGSDGSTSAYFANKDRFASGQYALIQSASGVTYLNAYDETPSSAILFFRTNGTSRMHLTQDGLTILDNKEITYKGQTLDDRFHPSGDYALQSVLVDLSTNFYVLQNTTIQDLSADIADISSSHYDLSSNHYALQNVVVDLSGNVAINISNIEDISGLVQVNIADISLNDSRITDVENTLQNLQNELDNINVTDPDTGISVFDAIFGAGTVVSLATVATLAYSAYTTALAGVAAAATANATNVEQAIAIEALEQSRQINLVDSAFPLPLLQTNEAGIYNITSSGLIDANEITATDISSTDITADVISANGFTSATGYGTGDTQITPAFTDIYSIITTISGDTINITGNSAVNVNGNINLNGNNITGVNVLSFSGSSIEGLDTLNFKTASGSNASISNLKSVSGENFTIQADGDAIFGSKTISTLQTATQVGTLITTAIDALVGNAGSGYDTLVELQNEIENNDLSLNEVFTNVATKVSKSGDTMTGDLTIQDGNLTIEHSSNTGDFDPYILLNSNQNSVPYEGISSIFLTERFINRNRIQGAYMEYNGDPNNNFFVIGTQNNYTGNDTPRVEALRINRGSGNIISASDPTDDTHLTNKSYVDTADNTLQGNIDSEASTRASADTTLQTNIDNEETARIDGDALKVSKSGDTMTGNLTLDGTLSAGATTINGTLDVSATTINGDLTINPSNVIYYKGQTLDDLLPPNSTTFVDTTTDQNIGGVKTFSNNVGIGTNDPSSNLHISSGTSGNCVLTLEADTDNNDENDTCYIDFKQDNGKIWSSIYTDNNALNIANSVSNDGGIIFKTGNINPASHPEDNAYKRMKITSVGNVEINKNLSIGDDISGNGKYTQIVSSANDNNQEFILTGTSVRRSREPHHIDTYGEGLLGAFGRKLYLNYHSNSDVSVGGNTGGNLHCYNDLDVSGNISIDGNIGIGTSTPDERLHLKNSGANLNILVETNNPNTAGLYLTEGYASETNYYGGSVRYDGNANRLIFGTAGNTPVDAFYIVRGSDNVIFNGNVGIGTTNTQEALVVNGNVGIDDDLVVGGVVGVESTISSYYYKTHGDYPLISQVHSFIQPTNSSNNWSQGSWLHHSPTFDSNQYNSVRGVKTPVPIIPYAISVSSDSDTESLTAFTFQVRARGDTANIANLDTGSTDIMGSANVSLEENVATFAVFSSPQIIQADRSWGLYVSSMNPNGYAGEIVIKVFFYQGGLAIS